MNKRRKVIEFSPIVNQLSYEYARNKLTLSFTLWLNNNNDDDDGDENNDNDNDNRRAKFLSQ